MTLTLSDVLQQAPENQASQIVKHYNFYFLLRKMILEKDAYTHPSDARHWKFAEKMLDFLNEISERRGQPNRWVARYSIEIGGHDISRSTKFSTLKDTLEMPAPKDVSGWVDTNLDSVRGTETPKDPSKGYVALLGWSINAIKAAQNFDRRYIVVAPDWAADFCEANNIPFMPWDFSRLNDRSFEIARRLKDDGVDVAIPLFEETVEWAGAINAVLMDQPRMYGQSILFRDKALMKRRAQLGGIRVGIFEEAYEKDDIVRFMKRVNQTLLKLDGDPDDPIHVKAFDKAGCLGHRMIRDIEDIDKIPDEEYPLLMESHLDGWEFAVEAWIHDGEIKFLNISEYVTLGYSVFVPATKELEQWREAITQQIEKLIKTFDIKFGQIHPEYFLTSDGEMYFGEVAYRPPGFKAFELIEKAYGFNAYQASILVFDPKSTKQEVEAFFPREVDDAKGYAGCFGVYPRRRVVSKLEMPEETVGHPYFDTHELVEPAQETVPERSAFGTHWGLVFFVGDDPIKMRDLLKAQEDLDFYV